VCSSTMRLSTFCGLHRDTEHCFRKYLSGFKTTYQRVSSLDECGKKSEVKNLMLLSL
jgi:hypothetical protein